jgi:hypothetical protein
MKQFMQLSGTECIQGLVFFKGKGYSLPVFQAGKDQEIKKL